MAINPKMKEQQSTLISDQARDRIRTNTIARAFRQGLRYMYYNVLQRLAGL